MKILQACAYAAPYEGNFMRSLYALDDQLKQFGCETIYALPETIRNNDWVKRLSKRRQVYFMPVRKARILPETYLKFGRVFSENKDIEIVHSHFELYDIPAVLTSPQNVKVYWHLHDPIDVNRKGNRALLERIQYRFFSKRVTLLSVAEKYRNDLIEAGFPEDQAFTLPNGIDLERISLKGDNESEFAFLAYVWDFRRKGCDLIIKSSKTLIDKGYNFRVLLIGNDETRRYIDENYHEIGSHFIVGHAEQDINKLLGKAHSFISASRAETFSYAVCEAAYAGLNVISSDISGLEWAKCLPTVSFFEAENVSMLCDLMENCLLNKVIDKQELTITRKEIEKNFSVDHWVQQVCKFYGIR